MWVLYLISLSAMATEPSRYVSCFTATGEHGNKINLMYVEVTYDKDQWDSSYVKYEKSNKAISLLPEYINERDDGTKSTELTMKWRELIGTTYHGEYTSISQGVYIKEFSYKSDKGKVYKFNEDSRYYNSETNSCEWSK